MHEKNSTMVEKDNTFIIPALDGLNCKPGDTLTVVGKDSEGNIEVEHSGSTEEGEDWKSDMRKTVASDEEPPMEESY